MGRICAMIDLQDLRKRPEAYQNAADQKNIKVNVAHLIGLDEKRRERKTVEAQRRAVKDSASKQIPTLKGEDKTKLIAEMKTLGEELKVREEELTKIESEWNPLLLQMPTIPHPSVPVGKDDKGNVEARKHGDVPAFKFPVKD